MAMQRKRKDCRTKATERKRVPKTEYLSDDDLRSTMTTDESGVKGAGLDESVKILMKEYGSFLQIALFPQ